MTADAQIRLIPRVRASRVAAQLTLAPDRSRAHTVGSRRARPLPLLPIALIVALVACSDRSPLAPSVIEVLVLPADTALLALGDTTRFRAETYDAGGALISGVTIQWSSSSPSVAMVDQEGLATAWANGTASIIAAAANVGGTARLVVAQRVASVNIAPDTAWLDALGDTTRFHAEARDANGNLISGTSWTWSVSAASVGRVDRTGLATALDPGSASITVTSAERTAEATLVVSPLKFASIAAGGEHGCAITTTGAAYCWGRGDHGQLGQGPNSSGESCSYVGGGGTWLCESRPWRVASGTIRFSSIVLGGYSSCALAEDRRAYCWGRNMLGALGIGHEQSPVTSPTPVAGQHVFTSLALRSGGACATTDAGATYCWGDARYGQLGIGEENTGETCQGTVAIPCRTQPVPISGSVQFRQLSSGGRGALHTCGVSDTGTAYCWGINEYIELGTTTTEICSRNTPCSTLPVPVDGGLTFELVVAGVFDTCGLVDDGTAYCWGSNLSAGFWSQPEPVAVPGGFRFASLTKGGGHTCGLTTGGDVYCWGQGNYGQRGDGTTSNASEPVPVSGGLKFASVDAGAFSTCGVTIQGIAYCWGINSYGALGNPASTEECFDGFSTHPCSTIPLPVSGQQDSPAPASKSPNRRR